MNQLGVTRCAVIIVPFTPRKLVLHLISLVGLFRQGYKHTTNSGHAKPVIDSSVEKDQIPKVYTVYWNLY